MLCLSANLQLVYPLKSNMEHSAQHLATLRAIIQWSAYHHQDASLARKFENFLKIDSSFC